MLMREAPADESQYSRSCMMRTAASKCRHCFGRADLGRPALIVSGRAIKIWSASGAMRTARYLNASAHASLEVDH
jgi:hypothetical protein